MVMSDRAAWPLPMYEVCNELQGFRNLRVQRECMPEGLRLSVLSGPQAQGITPMLDSRKLNLPCRSLQLAISYPHSADFSE